MFEYVVSENGIDTVVTVGKRNQKPEGSMTIAAFLKRLAADEDLGGIIPEATVFEDEIEVKPVIDEADEKTTGRAAGKKDA